MKTLNYSIAAFLLGSIFISCQDQLKPYSTTDNKVGFYNEGEYKSIDTLINYTFVFEDSKVTSDTIYIGMRTLGFVVNYDRPIKLKQVPIDKGIQAVAGTHYVPFDDPSVAKHYIIPANKNYVNIPLVVKRDKSLKENKYYMKIMVENNEHFTQSWIGEDYMVIELSDLLTKPKEWTSTLEYYFLGKYGQAKHQFMFETVGERIDDNYLKNILPNPSVPDMAYLQYMSGFYSSELRKYNAQRVANGLGLLREEPTIEGTEGALVQFVLYNEPLPVI